MPIHQSQLRNFIKYNVITSSEAAEILEVTRQRITSLISEGELVPVKESSQGLLFLKADVEALKRKKRSKSGLAGYYNSFPYVYHSSGITHEALGFFKENIDSLDEIVSVCIYFQEIDSITDGYFVPSDFYYGELQYIENPYLVLKDITGKEMWLGGCNCGYGGEGPHGSATILKSLGISEELINLLFKHRVIKYIKNLVSNQWECYSRKEFVDSYDSDDTAQTYLFKGNLVLIQSPHFIWRSNPEKILEKYRAFIPNPTEVIIFPSEEQAKENGYVALSDRKFEEVYRLIIRDLDGRELWLHPVVDKDQPIHEQKQLINILESCGFDIPKESRQRSWLNMLIRKVTVAPPIYLKK